MIHEVLEDIVDEEFLEFVCDKLRKEAQWSIGAGPTEEVSSRITEDIRCETGFIYKCYQRETINLPVFSSLADYIVYNYIKKSNFIWEGLNLDRMFYNYYNSGSSGVFHEDYSYDNCISLLINLNDNDGGTEIEDTFVSSKAGRLISFDSNMQHRGVGPSDYQQRFALNIVFQYTNKVAKLKED